MPHSEIHGSKPIRSSPRLIAAYHVLHRLCMPRHPPNALTTLDRSHCRCPSFAGFATCPSRSRERLANLTRRTHRSVPADPPSVLAGTEEPGGPGLPFTTPAANNAIDVFDAAPAGNTPSVSGPASSRPASRVVSGCARSGNADPCPRPDRANPNRRTALAMDRPVSRHPDTIFSSRFHQNSRAPKPAANFVSFRISDRPPQAAASGGAERDRTADPLLAKQVLSQLSYSPIFPAASPRRRWWARVNSNYRPHPYQGCALTD